MDEFVHLHLHSEYSLLDGACRIKNIPDSVLALSQGAVALTDHGVMYGAVDFYRACKSKGIKPIIGCEVYLTKNRNSRDKEYSHLVLLVKNEVGYENLISLVSSGFTEGFYSRPRIDMELLKTHSEGLIALSGCLYGFIPQSIIAGDFNGARNFALQMKEIFGDDFYFEIQNHGIPDEERVIKELAEMSGDLGISLVATNDVHYLKKSDSSVQKVLSDIRNDSESERENPFDRPEFYLKSGSEMAALFSEYPQAISNTLKIAEKCNYDFTFGKTLLPEYPLPQGQSPDNYLRMLASEGLEKLESNGLIAEGHTKEDYKFRMLYELMVISKMGYSGYYLIVRDFIIWSVENGIAVGPGRGSGAGSLVAYLVGITRIDPILHGLLFERFLNPERVSMPDFDTDFADDRREDVIKYVSEKYGNDRVCQIVAFGTLAARAAVRDAGRALGMPYQDVDVVAKLIPKDIHITISRAMEQSPKLMQMYKDDEKTRRLLDISMAIEGMPRHTTIHAAGVVISKYKLDTLVPLCKSGDTLLTQFDMNTVADLGLLKFDFLAIRYLTVISNTEKQIKMTENDFSVENIKLDDDETLNLISSGDTSGIFQLESSGMKKLLSTMKPRSIEDIMVAISLYRPGPMDSIPKYLENREHPDKIVYECEQLEEILSETYGCIVYQEQVMQICRRLAAYSYGRADTVRRLMSKKKVREMELERDSFVQGSYKNGIPTDVSNEIFDRMAKFAEYAFCKSHAAAYSYTSYRTAYLKKHYPAEYSAALLSSVAGNPKKTAEYMGSAAAMGIVCKGPDINSSGISFTSRGNEIYYGLSGIKNIGLLFAEKAVHERENGGEFKNFYDFISRMYPFGINKTQVYALICSGAFDSFNITRSSLITSYEEILLKIGEKRKSEIDGQIGFSFDGDNTQNAPKPGFSIDDMPEIELFAKLQLEKEMTGMYFSGHPLDAYTDLAIREKAMNITEFLTYYGDDENPGVKDRKSVKICGILTKISPKKTANGDTMAFVTLEDRYSECEVIFFKEGYARYGSVLRLSAPLLISGNLSFRDDGDPAVICFEAREMKNPSEAERVQMKNEKSDIKTAESKNLSKIVKSGRSVQRLFVKVSSMDSTEQKRITALAGIFTGNTPLVFYSESEKKYYDSRLMIAADKFVISKAEDIVQKGNVILK